MVKEEPEVMGRFGAVFGVRGFIRVISYTEIPESLFAYKPWFYRKPGGPWEGAEITDHKPHADGFVARVKGFDARETVRELTGCEIGILPSSLPRLAEGEYRWIDLIGLGVETLGGCRLGVVGSMMETGANDVLVVKAPENDPYDKKERLIPYITGVVKTVDLDRKVILVDWEPDF